MSTHRVDTDDQMFTEKGVKFCLFDNGVVGIYIVTEDVIARSVIPMKDLLKMTSELEKSFKEIKERKVSERQTTLPLGKDDGS